MSNEVVTRHVGLASFLRYALGDAAHVATTKVGSGFTFSFADPNNQCPDLEKAFFAEGGAAVGDARVLLDCAKAAKTTMAIAQRLGGVWENQGEIL